MRVASDVGGTFSDLAFLDETTGIAGVAKASTTPRDFAIGVMETLRKAGIRIADTSFFVHGSTVVINALTERKGAITALITTQGFRDVLEIGRANRPDIYNLQYAKPAPFVPRRLRFEVAGRMNAKGDELAPLDDAGVEAAVAACKAEGVASIAVCFLHSYANPAHEQKCGEIIARLAPEIRVTLSHQITQEWREYERTNTAVLNSYVLPVAAGYLNNLEAKLSEAGMARVYHAMQSNGGNTTFDDARRMPIKLIESGPVAGVIGAAVIGESLGERNVISLDIGGTTAKTSLIENNTPRITTSYKIGHTPFFAGYPILVPTVDIVEIGAGGGSIAWIDKAGALRVGPASAGADPGPACYNWGGTQPTVTDANLVAGRINPTYFLGGEIPLDVERARDALAPLAATFGISIEKMAMGVIQIADAAMVNALKLVSVRRGYDPRDFVLVAFGGGGAMHAAALMRELRVKKVVIPSNASVFSAWGMLMTDLRQDTVRTHVIRTDRVAPERMEAIYATLEAQASRDLVAQGGTLETLVFQRFADMRYLGQEHTVKVMLPGGAITTKTMSDIEQRFHAEHEHAYAFQLASPIEFVNCHLTAWGGVHKPTLQQVSGEGTGLAAAHKGMRRVNFDELGFQDAAIYERDLLPLDVALAGPLVVEEPASTTVVFPGQQVRRDRYGFLHIESM